MIKNLLDLQTILSELGEGARIWGVANEDEKTILIVPDKSGEHILWIFLKREDCDHLAHILMKLNPQFRDVHLAAKETTVGVVLEYSKEEQCPVALIAPTDAYEFFKEYEEFLGHYYGIE